MVVEARQDGKDSTFAWNALSPANLVSTIASSWSSVGVGGVFASLVSISRRKFGSAWMSAHVLSRALRIAWPDGCLVLVDLVFGLGRNGRTSFISVSMENVPSCSFASS